LRREFDGRLQEDAETGGMTVSSLLSSIVTKYAEWDRYARKFGYISIPSDVLKSLLQAVDDEEIADIAQDLGSRLIKELVQFWFNEVNVERLIEYVLLLCNYSGIGEYELHSQDTNHTVIIRHELGQKWSNFMSVFIDAAMKNTFGITIDSQASPSQVNIRFAAKPAQR